MGFTIIAPGIPSQNVGPITPNPGDLPIQTAVRLAAEVGAPFTAEVTENPPREQDTNGSADILIRGPVPVKIVGLPDPDTGLLTFSTDTGQSIKAGIVNPLPKLLEVWDISTANSGSTQQRVILKNYDTGDDRIDIFVVDGLNIPPEKHTFGGRNVCSMFSFDAMPEFFTHPARTGIKCSVFVAARAVGATPENHQNRDSDPLDLASAVAGVAAELVFTREPNQLLSRLTNGNEAVGATKRLRDGPCKYIAPAGTFNVVQRLREKGAPMMERW
jgi:hypothetical protein